MAFSVTLSAEDIAFAENLNILRRIYTTHHKPAHVRDADLVGCTAEVAICKQWNIPYTELGYDHGGGGDGGKDLVINGVAIDVKSSYIHPDSWLVKYPRCSGPRKRADWYIFAFVEMPYTVHFLGKQECKVVGQLPPFKLVRGARRVTLADTIPIAATDFIHE